MSKEKNKIAVIGSEGYVGKSFVEMMEEKYQIVKYDPKLGDDNASKEEVNCCRLGVVCVPTPMHRKKSVTADEVKVYQCDTSIVESVVDWLETDLILIKSTVEVGTTERLKKETDKRIVFSPEYVGETSYRVSIRMRFHKDMGATPFWIMGGDKKDCDEIFDILLPVVGPEKTFFKTDSRTAEFIKYKENDYFAHKVVWANEARQQAEALGVNWYDAWQGWKLDPRVDVMHTGVFKDARGFAGACLPKDTNALAYSCKKAGLTPRLLMAMLKKNMRLKEIDDYQEISGRKE
jgi:nucleotide sugar dehydrogenase